jgi:WD40 repeat protein
MKRIYITIGSRVEHEGDSPEDKGEFLVIDWETKQRVGAWACESGENILRGRSRGASGMAWHEDKIYICCRGGIMSLDPDTYAEVSRADSRYGGFHGMASDGETLWVTSLGKDILLGIRNDEVVAEIDTLQDVEGLPPCPTNTNGLNAVGFSPQGEMFLLYSHRLALYNWTTRRIAASGLDHSAHDICFLNDTDFLFCKSSRRELVKASISTGELQVVFSGPGSPDSPEHAITGWLRGIAYDSETNVVFVAGAPGTLRELDATTWSVRHEYVFDTRPAAAPFELLLDPRDWT